MLGSDPSLRMKFISSRIMSPGKRERRRRLEAFKGNGGPILGLLEEISIGMTLQKATRKLNLPYNEVRSFLLTSSEWSADYKQALWTWQLRRLLLMCEQI